MVCSKYGAGADCSIVYFGGGTMSLLVLILVLLGGGALSWGSEKLSGKAPKWVSLGVLLLSSIVLLMLCQEKDSVGIFSQYYAPWIERFGISISLAIILLHAK